MAIIFNRSTASIAAATATRLSDILAAEGYAGHMAGQFLEISPGALTDLFMGDSSSVSASNGRPVQTPFNQQASPGRAVDPGGIWLFSTGGGDFELTFIPL